MGKTLGVIFAVIVLIFIIGIIGDGNSNSSGLSQSSGSVSSSNRQAVLKSELSYLNDIIEITWWEVEDNNVYINFNPVPNDWNLIMRGAAFRGNKAIDFGTHVWALKGKKEGWRPGHSPYLGVATARYGEFEEKD